MEKKKRLKISCEAVTAYKVGDITFESVLLQIENGNVVGYEVLTRAPDMSKMAITTAVKKLWKNLTLQRKKAVYHEAS